MLSLTIFTDNRRAGRRNLGMGHVRGARNMQALTYARQLANTRQGAQRVLDDAEQRIRDLLDTTDMKKTY
uniref:Transposase n=1 Tax=Globodera pallida TaxID=36090 RepID=A0A183BKC1_GLOPA